MTDDNIARLPDQSTGSFAVFDFLSRCKVFASCSIFSIIGFVNNFPAVDGSILISFESSKTQSMKDKFVILTLSNILVENFSLAASSIYMALLYGTGVKKQ